MVGDMLNAVFGDSAKLVARDADEVTGSRASIAGLQMLRLTLNMRYWITFEK